MFATTFALPEPPPEQETPGHTLARPITTRSGAKLGAGDCCVERVGVACRCCLSSVSVRSFGEFGEPGRGATTRVLIDAEFVVAAPEVLDERVTSDDHTGGAVLFQSARRSEPGFESTMISLDPVVRILVGVMQRAR